MRHTPKRHVCFLLSSRLYGRHRNHTGSCLVQARGVYRRLGLSPNPEGTFTVYQACFLSPVSFSKKPKNAPLATYQSVWIAIA